MEKRSKIADRPDLRWVRSLDDATTIALYLSGVLEANDLGLLVSSLRDIARARGMSEVAKSAGITREALYKALRPGGTPRFETINRVCTALGVRFAVEPILVRGLSESESESTD